MQYVTRYQQGAIVKGGTVVTHQCIRTKSNKISTFDLHQTKIFESSSFSNGQHHCTSTLDLHQSKIFESSSCSNGQHHCTSTLDLHQTKIFESSSFSNGQHHCANTFDLHQTKIFESSSFSNGQHHCTSTFDLHQTKIFQSSSFSNGQHHRTSTFDLLPEGGNTKIRFVCSKAISPTNPVPCLETRPFRSGDSVPQQIWGNQFLYAFPPFCLILQVLKKVSYDQTEKILLVTPTWQSQILYPLLLEMSIV